jgi:hypothetical protein
MTSYIGLFMLLAIFGAIFLVGRKTSRDQAAFGAALAGSGFCTPTEMPPEWLPDFGYLTARSGLLVEGHPLALLLVGHRSGTSIATAGGQIPSLDLFLGFALTPDWRLNPAQFAQLVGRAKPDASAVSPGGACLLVWKRNHTSTNLRAMIETVRREVTALLAKSPAPPTVPTVPSASLPSPEPNDTFIADNMWPWRKENNFGYEELPPEALLPQIRVISLRFHALPKLPAAIGSLRNLESLTLFQTELSELPEEIGMCRKLRDVSIAQSKLANLPASLFRLPCIESLNLRRNGLTSIPDDIGNLASLRELVLNANPLTSLPEAIGRLTKLEVLGVACYKLESLPVCVASMHHLKELVLHADGPLASQIDRWKAALPNPEVRVAGLIEIAAIG